MAVGLLCEYRSKAVHSVDSCRSEGGWRGRWVVAESVAAILAVLVAFAYASPPDPSWIPGMYDDHDYDDVVGMVTDGAGVSDPQVSQRVECVLAGSVPRTATGRIRRPIAHRQTIRSPPIEVRNASADPLLTSAPRALRVSSVPLIVSAPSRGVIRSFSSWASPVSPRKWGAWPGPGAANV